MTKHTPGPWEANCLGSEGYYIYPVREHTKETLRERMHAFANTELDPGNPERSAANARLIAAAPDLLEAAESMVALAYEYNAVRGKLVRDTPEDDLYADRIEALETAIAKARGENEGETR